MLYVIIILGFIGIAYLIVESNDDITANQKKIYDKLKDIEMLLKDKK